jgi:Beta-propeller repeat
VRVCLGLALTEAAPDHSTISRARRLIDLETHREVFTWVLQSLGIAGLVMGKTSAIDVTALEANAAWRSILRRDTGETHNEFLTMRKSGHMTLGILLFVGVLGFVILANQFASTAETPNGLRGDQVTVASLSFSTYIGGSRVDSIRDVATDSEGNIYITGGTESPDFPTTPGAYDRTFNGWHDVFVAKFDRYGKLLWSTFLGGPNYDRAYAIEVDRLGYVYVAGRAGPGFPTTPASVQPIYQGYYTGKAYGDQNGFVAKLTPDGKRLVFTSYIGVGQMCRDLAIDRNGDIYVPLEPSKTTTPPGQWRAKPFQGSSQKRRGPGIAKIKSDGSQVLWARNFGGSSDGGAAPSVRVGADGFVYVVMQTQAGDMSTTPRAYNRTGNGLSDIYVAKLTADGSHLVFATYLGGSNNEFSEAHQISIDRQGNIYVATGTASPDFPTTKGVAQPNYGGGKFDIAVAKSSSDGRRLLASTFIGGGGSESIEGIDIDTYGNVYISGTTDSQDFPITKDALQRHNRGGEDGFVVKLSSDLTRVLYATYLGGSGDDGSRSLSVDFTDDILFAGWTRSDDFPTLNAFQTNRRGDWDGAVAKLTSNTSRSRK